MLAEIKNLHASDAFFNEELEDEIRSRSMTQTCLFIKDSGREKHMEGIVDRCKEMVYPHERCTEACKQRGSFM